MEQSVPETALVLVAVMPAVRDMEIARLLGWYRIPLRRAPKVINVDYLAFYQTGAFGEAHRWCIESIARVRGHELTSRAELFRDQPEHPRAKEEYYKISLGELHSLRQAILATGWRRITFFYTTGELLNKAVTINDLVVRTDERDILWRSLRERAMQNGLYQSDPQAQIELDASLLLMLQNINKLALG